MSTNPQIFNPANSAIVEDIKTELRLQGHRFTGALEASLREREIVENNGITLTAEALGYLEELEHGVTAGNIDTQKININKLTAWVKGRGFAGDPKQIAYAIIGKWKKEGKPLEGSRRFSQTGEILHAVRDTFEKNDKKYIDMIDKPVFESLDKIFHEVKSGTI